MYLPLQLLPKLSEDKFYYHEIIGFKVVDENYGDVGIIIGINDSSAQPLFVIKNNEKEILSYRKVPEYHDDIIKFAKKRSPINHPAVMYKKSAVEKSGGYKKMMWFEDYYLWARMILNGAKFYNIQEPLVNMRAGYRQLERRGGLKYAIEEFKFLYRLKEIGFVSTIQFIKSVMIRFVARILPKSLLKNIYRKIRG